ncbi:MAG: ATP synthase F1 subunit gamma [Anaerolineae bacterium]
MATAREIKRRIQSVSNMGQVTNALQAVSASKVRKAQDAVLGTRAYARAAWEVIVNLGGTADPSLHPLLARDVEADAALIVLITADRGLCGAYNHSIMQTTLEFAGSVAVPIRYITVGEKGRDLMWRLGKDVVAEFPNFSDVPSLAEVSPIALAATDEFLAGHVSEIYLAYTDFVNLLTQNPAIQPLLPLCQPQVGEQSPMACVLDLHPAQITEYIYEPDVHAILDEILPRFIELQLYQAVLEGQASEHAARMVAMRNATENAEELERDLTLDYNKARQRSITREILDIAGGSEALEQERASATA